MIEVRNMTFSYGNDKQALQGMDFTVEDGEIFGFLGRRFPEYMRGTFFKR